MFGTLIWRFQEAWKVLTGKKNNKIISQNNSPLREDESPEHFLNRNHDLKDLINSISIEFCFSEFGESRVNAGGSNFRSFTRLDPSLTSLRRYFPNAKYTVYSDFIIDIPGVNVIHCSSPIEDKEHPRFFYRTADYFKFVSLTESTSDFKCVIDTDMLTVSPQIYILPYITKIFGFCAPQNSRNLLKKDIKISLDTFKIKDLSAGFGHSYNQSPMTLWKDDLRGNLFFRKCADIMKSDPSRASLVMWKAAHELGFSPYLLPSEWCVCAEDIGIGDEVLLHVGHSKVSDYYKV